MKKTNWRSFVSIYMGYSFLLMSITGIVLYFAPPGRVAHWSNWTFLGFTKGEWEALHTLFSFVWVGFTIYHLIYNWKPFLNYIRRKAKEGAKLRKEFAYATVLTAVVFAGTYLKIPPFQTVMDFGEYLTESWSDENTEPPIPHAELLTLNEFSRTVNIPIEKILTVLKKNGFEVPDTTIKMKDLAELNGVSPNKIYETLKAKNSKTSPVSSRYAPGSGMGRKLLSEILNENGMSWEKGIAALKEKGIVVTKDEKLKTIAESNNTTPMEILRALGFVK